MTNTPSPSAFDEFMRTILFLPERASTIGQELDELHYLIWIITTGVAVVTLVVATWFAYKYRRRPGVKRTEIAPHPPVWFEVSIYLIPLVIFVWWFVVGFRSVVKLQVPPADSMNIYVMGKKWMFKFAYEGGPNAINVLRVPAHRPVRLLMTSRDVIHGFYVPELRIKEDVPVAHTNEIWFEATRVGVYDIFCTEYCGTGHSLMRGSVQVMEPHDFDEWLVEQKRGLALRQDSGGPLDPMTSPTLTMVQQGKKAGADLQCYLCHSVDGSKGIGPTWLGLYHKSEKLVDGSEAYVDEAYLTKSMMDPMADLVAGYPPNMPTYQGRMNGPQAAAIVEYIKSLQDDRIAQAPKSGANK